MSPPSPPSPNTRHQLPQRQVPGAAARHRYGAFMAGRPTALTPEVAKVLIQTSGLGHSREQAAAAAGIGGRTFQEWLARGRNARDNAEQGKHTPRTEEPFLALLAGVERAKAHRLAEALGAIREAWTGWDVLETTTVVKQVPTQITEEVDGVTTTRTVMVEQTTRTEKQSVQRAWAAAAWWCERNFPEDFGRRYRHEVVAGSVDDVADVIGTGDAAALLASIRSTVGVEAEAYAQGIADAQAVKDPP